MVLRKLPQLPIPRGEDPACAQLPAPACKPFLHLKQFLLPRFLFGDIFSRSV